MANPADPVLSHHTSQEGQPAAVPELPNDQPHQPHKQLLLVGALSPVNHGGLHQSEPPKQSHDEDHAEQTEATGGDHR